MISEWTLVDLKALSNMKTGFDNEGNMAVIVIPPPLHLPHNKEGGGVYGNHRGLLSFSLSFHVHALSRRYLLNCLTSFNGMVMHANEPVYHVKKGLAITAVGQDIISFVNLYNFNIHFQKLLLVYCPGHARVKGNDQADRLAGKASQLACISEDLKC